MTEQRRIAYDLLNSVARELEGQLVANGCCNTLLTRYAGDAAQVLGFDVLVRRFQECLARSGWNGFFGGVITNIDLPQIIPDHMRQLNSLEKALLEFPLFWSGYAEKACQNYLPELAKKIAVGFDYALKNADSETEIEEIALTLALLGHHDDAIEVCSQLREADRYQHIPFVIAIEHFRNERVKEGNDSISRLPKDELSGWSAAQFAVGICNHVPWFRYPYPDW